MAALALLGPGGPIGHSQSLKKIQFCEDAPELIPFISRGKYGYVNRWGQVVVKAQFDYAGTFKADFLTSISSNASKYGSKDYAQVSVNALKYRVDKSGEFVLRMDTVKAVPANCCPEVPRQITAYEEQGLWGLKDAKNQILVGAKYQKIDYLFWLSGAEDYFLVQLKNRYGVISARGEVVVPIIYEHLYNMNGNAERESGILLHGTLNGKHRILDICGNVYSD